MNDKKDDDVKGIVDAYEALIQSGAVKREFVLKLLAGKVDWDQRLKDKFEQQKRDKNE